MHLHSIVAIIVVKLRLFSLLEAGGMAAVVTGPFASHAPVRGFGSSDFGLKEFSGGFRAHSLAGQGVWGSGAVKAEGSGVQGSWLQAFGAKG